MDIREQLIRFEGWRNSAYCDPITRAEPWAIGVGHTGADVEFGAVWSNERISATLDADIRACTAACEHAFSWFGALNPPRQAVLIGMAFQLGVKGLQGFKRTLAACGAGDFSLAASEMLNSTWAQQTPARARALATQMRRGEWY